MGFIPKPGHAGRSIRAGDVESRRRGLSDGVAVFPVDFAAASWNRWRLIVTCIRPVPCWLDSCDPCDPCDPWLFDCPVVRRISDCGRKSALAWCDPYLFRVYRQFPVPAQDTRPAPATNPPRCVRQEHLPIPDRCHPLIALPGSKDVPETPRSLP